ncbi:MAG: MFS transporter [Thiolinea sp.]
MEKSPPQNGFLILLASMLLMVVLGSVHAFSVFLEPLETQFQASRSAVSLTYSFALMTLTTMVLFGHRLYGLLRPAMFMVLVCLLAAAGAGLAAIADRLSLVWLGYSLLFGAANGLGYGYALQISAQANPQYKGFAMGLVTASYALGAALAPWPLSAALTAFGFSGAMYTLALALLVVLPLIAGAFVISRASLALPENGEQHNTSYSRLLVLQLWLAYGLAVTAGLMAIGHATGIAQKGGVDPAWILIAPVVLAIFNMAGSLLGGWMSDRFSARLILTLLPLLSALSLLLLSQWLSGEAVLAGIAVTGFAYGAIIAVYPAVVSALFGAVAGIRVYGRIFIAWGLAGLSGPWLAGVFYDRYADYSIALLVAACAGLLSALIAFLTLQRAESIAD